MGLMKTTNKLQELYFSNNMDGVVAHASRFSVTGLHEQSQIVGCRAIMKSSTVPVITLPHVVSLTFIYDDGGGGGEGTARAELINVIIGQLN
jgi:hypothetical protein